MNLTNQKIRWLLIGILGLGLWTAIDGLAQTPISVINSNAPDLTGSWLNLTQKCRWSNDGPQCTIIGKFEAQNIGTLKTSPSKIRFFLSNDSIFDENDDTLLKEAKMGSLNAGQKRTIRLNVRLPVGTYVSDQFIIALVDADDVSIEPDETNNDISIGPIPAGKEFFPFAQGDTWQFQGTLSENGGSSIRFLNKRMIIGTKMVGEIETTVFTETNPNNSGVMTEEYLVKDDRGITYWGTSGEINFFTPPMVPLQRILFPLQLRSTFSQTGRGIDLGEDFDGDGVNETASVTSKVTAATVEEVTVPVGSFADSVKIETKVTVNVKLSWYHTNVKVKGIQTEWFAPRVGMLKRALLIETTIGREKMSEEIVEELIGYIIDEEGKGMVHIPIAEDIATPNSDTTSPGRPAIGFDGTNYLIASCKQEGSMYSISGTFLSETGVVLNSFSFPLNFYGCDRPDVAFDGTNYLITHVKEGLIFGMRVTPSGTMLDDPPGFQISPGPPFSSNFLSAVAFDGTNYLVAWAEFDTVNSHDISGARVTPQGQVLDKFTIFSGPGSQVFPSVAFDGVSYMVVWEDIQFGTGWEERNIVGTRVTPAGVILDPDAISISTAPYFQEAPHLSFDGTNYFAVWIDGRRYPNNPQASFSDIFGTRIRPDGTLLDGTPDTGGISINISPLKTTNPRVIFDGNDYFVVWDVISYAPPNGIFGAKVSKDGTLLSGTSDEVGIPLSGPPPYDRYYTPSIYSNGNTTLIAWIDEAGKDILGILLFLD